MTMKSAILSCAAFVFSLAVFVATHVAAQEAAAPPKKAPRSVEADPNLPNVLILGDSISIGYTPYVRDILKGKANVYRPATADGKHPINCGNTKMGLAGIDKWLGDTKWDVIHFNWGLWDMSYRYPQNQDNKGERTKVKGAISFTPEQYAENLEKLVERLEKTGAKLIWGSISLVPDGEEGRVLGDDLRFNEAAAKVMKKHNIPIDDINALTRTFDASARMAANDVHYKGEYSQKIAVQVADWIEKSLPKKK